VSGTPSSDRKWPRAEVKFLEVGTLAIPLNLSTLKSSSHPGVRNSVLWKYHLVFGILGFDRSGLYYEGVVYDLEKSDTGFLLESWHQKFLQASHPPVNSTYSPMGDSILETYVCTWVCVYM